MPCTLEPWEIEVEERNANKHASAGAVTDKELITKIACAGMRHMEKTGEPIPDFAEAWWKRHKKWDKSQGR